MKQSNAFQRMSLSVVAGAVMAALLLSACALEHQPNHQSQNTQVQDRARVELIRQEEADLAKQNAAKKAKERTAPQLAERIEVIGSHVSANAPAAMSAGAIQFYGPPQQQVQENRENYDGVVDNPIKSVASEPVSTFALDVDTGAYSNVRRFLRDGELPPKDAVRVEELVNYFTYTDVDAEAGHPFAVQTEISAAPWNAQNYLLRLRIKATDMAAASLPPANLVFLVDVSGSMQDKNKLPLVQSSLLALVNEMRAEDTISLVVYAGRTQVELAPTSGANKTEIRSAISRLTAGGSTAGGAAIELAYEQAQKAFKKNGINRILLATDGDFNVGITNIDHLKRLVERKRDSGISLTTLGFGTGNYNDALMEQIADVGNGNYAYIDSADEARKVLITEMSSTFNIVAKDTKIQVEFNPATIAEYRLIGYENRLLNAEDFNNDKIDAGDVGAGKSVTALYELTPVGAKTAVDPMRYDENKTKAAPVKNAEELAFLKLRYKPKGSEKSVLIEKPIMKRDVIASLSKTSADYQFSAAVAGFGQLLRGGNYTKTMEMKDVIQLAKQGKANDPHGYRSEFIRLAELADSLLPSGAQRLNHVEREISMKQE